MACYKQPGVCGINPKMSPVFNDDNLFYKDQNVIRGPVCHYLKQSYIYISVANKYNKNEGIACYLELYNDNCLVACEKITKDASLNYRLVIHDTKKIENYTIKIFSPNKHGKVSSKENLGLENGITKFITIFSNTSNVVNIGITRKESILHDFHMKFLVNKNSSVKGEEPLYELSAMSEVKVNSGKIIAAAKKYGVDANIVKAIMYMETTHGYYDALPALVDKNMSLLPMNVRSDYWSDIGFSRKELKSVKSNIDAGVYLIKQLTDRVEPYSIESLASLYQNLGATKVSEYGARVKKIYEEKLWIPKPTILDEIGMEIDRFERGLKDLHK